MPTFLFRTGDGNDGDFPRYIVTLSDRDDPYTALAALLANEYIAGHRVRRFVMANLDIDGDPEYGLYGAVFEGPEGETAFGAAWETCQLQPLSGEDLDYYRDSGLQEYRLREVLDDAAYRFYCKERRR